MSEEKQKEQQEKREDTNIIYVGGKPFMNYVTAICMQFNEKQRDEVIVCGRGKFTSKCIDASLFSIRTFLKDLNIIIKSIKINDETFKTTEEKIVTTSKINIVLEKGK